MRSRTWIRPSGRSGNPSASDRANRPAVWRRCVWVIVAAVAFFGFGATLKGQAIPPELREFLAANTHFDESDLRDLEAGKPVAKLLPTKHKTEVAGVGAIRIAVPRDFFLAQIDDIVRYKQVQADPAP